MTVKAHLNFTLSVPSSMAQQMAPSKGQVEFHPALPTEHSQLSSLTDKKPRQLKINPGELESLSAFAEVIHTKAHKSNEAPLFTSGATATEDEVANISFFVRTLMPEAVSTQAIGITTGENIFQGGWAAVKATQRFKKAMKIDDAGGMFEGGVDAVRGVTQSIGGASYIGYRGVMIPADLNGIDTSLHAATPLGQTAFALGFFGNIMFGIFYLMIGLWATHGFVKDWQFSIGMKAHEGNDSALFDFLVKKVNADPKAKLAKLKTYWETLPVEKKQEQVVSFKRKLADSALSKFSEQYLEWQKELSSNGKLTQKPLTEKEVKATFKLLFEMQEKSLCDQGVKAFYLSKLGLSEEDLTDVSFTTLELIGFALEEKKRRCKHEAKFSRAVNGECAVAVKKAAVRGLSQRLKCDADPLIQGSAVKELAELKGKVTLENKKNKWVNAILIAVGVLGVASIVLGCFALPPAGATALVVITLLLVAAMMVTDGYCMLEGWKNGAEPGRFDKKYLIIISLVILAALGLSIGITLGFGLPLIPLILAGGIAAMGLTLTSFAYYKLTQKEKVWLENHPDLQVFKAALDSLAIVKEQELDEKVTLLFKKLSKKDRLDIRKTYLEMSKTPRGTFKQDKFKLLDAGADFGGAYLQKALIADAAFDEEYQLLVRAMKKTVKFFWEKAAMSKSEIDQERALKMQGLYERVVQKNKAGIIAKLDVVKSEDELYERLKNDIWYVVKRDESSQDLCQAIETVMAGKVTQLDPPVASVKAGIVPLVQRIRGEGVA